MAEIFLLANGKNLFKFEVCTKLKMLFQPQDDKNTLKLTNATNSLSVRNRAWHTFEPHHAFLSHKLITKSNYLTI